LLELDVHDLAADFFHAPDVDRLDDVPGFRIDRNRPRAGSPISCLGGRDHRFRVCISLGLLEDFVDEVMPS